MNSELLIPLIIYLVLVFAIAVYSQSTQRNKPNFLSNYFLGNRSMGGFVLAMTLAATYASASSFIGGPERRIKWG